VRIKRVARYSAVGSILLLIAVAASVWLNTKRSPAPSVVALPEAAPADSPTPTTSREAEGLSGKRDSDIEPRADRSPHDWLSLHTNSEDLFRFAQDTVQAALSGDHRAQYFLGQTLSDCETLVITVNLPHKDSFAANVQETLAKFSSNDAMHRRMQKRIERCQGFFSASPVGNLPEEQRAVRYWLDQALEGSDAFALMDRALHVAVAESTQDAERQAQRKDAVLNDIRQAVATREPAVMFRIGGLFTNPIVARDAAVQGSAWLLAACSAGYDCSSDNPNVGFGCAQAGICNGGFTIPDQLQRDLSPKEFAAAYAASQDILYKIRVGDWDGLEPHWALRQ
jgi:hypothetical protein